MSLLLGWSRTSIIAATKSKSRESERSVQTSKRERSPSCRGRESDETLVSASKRRSFSTEVTVEPNRRSQRRVEFGIARPAID